MRLLHISVLVVAVFLVLQFVFSKDDEHQDAVIKIDFPIVNNKTIIIEKNSNSPVKNLINTKEEIIKNNKDQVNNW